MVNSAEPAFAWLDDLALVRFSGNDARRFLHAQLTQDIASLSTAEARPAAWLDPKGRVRALFEVVPDADTFLLVASASLIETVTRQLGLFVLRDDVRIEVPGDLRVAALLGAAGGWLRSRDLALPDRPYALVRGRGIIWIRLAPEYLLAIGTAATLESELRELPEAAAGTAELAEIRLGLPRIGPETAGRFVPQMLNLDRAGGIAFDKGCYPGQEVVARAQNLGTIKRRLTRLKLPAGAAPGAGTDILDRAGNAAGEVIRATCTDDGVELLAVVALAKLDEPLTLSPDGRPVEPVPPA